MSETMRLTQTRIRAGIWEGILSGAGPEAPAIEVVLLEKPIPGISLQPVPGRVGDYALRVPIPAEALSEGVQTFLIRHAGVVLAHFSIVTGVAMEDDLRAELDLMRAELDMLKRAFRRHCLEVAGKA